MDKSKAEIRVRGYHLDGYQHVNNARYLELLEEARWQHYENYPPSYFIEKNWAFIIVNINISYKKSAVFGDVLEIHTQVSKIGNTSMSFHQEIFIKGSGTLSVVADVTFVILDVKTNKVVPMEGELKAVLLREIIID
ncbi:MAG: acyl-CoA thioesterase [Flavobacteriales bacterium]|nr:acyl-CoA thioesterase [Flavobacteriales bacterium]